MPWHALRKLIHSIGPGKSGRQGNVYDRDGYVGSVGTVTIAISREQPGEVKLVHKGIEVWVYATTLDVEILDKGTCSIVVAVTDFGVVVTRCPFEPLLTTSE